MAGGTVRFQAQNPAISGDKSTYVNKHGKTVKSGWANCTAFVAAMGAEFDSGVKITGTQVRKESNEPTPDSTSPGLNLKQVRAVLKHHGVAIDVETPIDFDELDDLRQDGHAIGLQLNYKPFLGTAFAGSKDFSDGHIVLWLPNGDVFDPLHDHRFHGIAKAPVRVPTSLLRKAAGSLELAHGTVGQGKAYAAIFPTRHPAGAPAPHPAAPAKPVTFRFGATSSGSGEYVVTAPVALVRSKPGGVPGKGNVVDRRRKGARIRVFGTTRQGQSVGGSRAWHQVDRAGTRYMHSSVIDPD
jgi:hypothetical protein